MQQNKISALVAQLTLEEKAGLCSGLDNWNTKPIQRLGVPCSKMSDGPHGLRTQAGEVNTLRDDASIKAVCFPAACATAASFDRDLLQTMGEELGRQSNAAGVNLLLGPGVNMKRSPLCGRNFEYFSEDPLLAGELGAAFVQGVQSQGTGACVKHFFANNQEYRRMDISAEIDERTLREVYLPAFETVIKKAQPWAVMAAYNKFEGTYATQSKTHLTDILRDEWGFEGLVVSDWGATHDRVAAVKAGCDVTMPAESTDGEIVKAVREGRLSEDDLNTCCKRVLTLALRGKKQSGQIDYTGGHALARRIAGESIVLLKNEGLLPLAKDATVAFIGSFAAAPRYQGGGSSHINSERVSNALDAAKAQGVPVMYAQGYNAKDGNTSEALLSEAVSIAKSNAAAVLFIGLPDVMESEGSDRVHMQLPEGHNRLVNAVCAAQPNTIVVLHNGSPVELPWADKTPAILEAYLGGQAIGEAVVDVLYGDVNPSGHLPETFPKKLQDNPSYLFFPGEGATVQYSERMFMGYRYYTSKAMDVLFPFGHGLSYTTFAFSNLQLDKAEMDAGDTVTASVTVTNTGSRPGKVVVQLYVSPPKGDVIRPLRELKEFAKIELTPGESKTVSFALHHRAFAVWSPAQQAWCTSSGSYAIEVCENAHTVLLSAPLQINSTDVSLTQEYTATTPMLEFAKHPMGKAFVEANLGNMLAGMAAGGFIPQELLVAVGYQPGNPVSMETIVALEQHAGASTGGASALLSQPVAMLLNFVPAEEKDAFGALLSTLNKK